MLSSLNQVRMLLDFSIQFSLFYKLDIEPQVRPEDRAIKPPPKNIISHNSRPAPHRVWKSVLLSSLSSRLWNLSQIKVVSKEVFIEQIL